MNIADMRTLVRRHLRDNDPADPRWPDDELDAHIQHALRDLSRAAPLEAVSNVAAVAGSREVSLAPLRGLLDVEGVEFPLNLHPACFVPFSLWGGSLTLQVDPPPARDDQLRVYFTRLHTLDATSSTVPDALQDTLAMGAAAFAALAFASYAANRVNLGGEDTARRYRIWGNERLEAFQLALGRAASRRGVRVRQMYPAGAPLPRQFRVRGA